MYSDVEHRGESRASHSHGELYHNRLRRKRHEVWNLHLVETLEAVVRRVDKASEKLEEDSANIHCWRVVGR